MSCPSYLDCFRDGRCLNSCCFVGYYFQDLFYIARSILVQFRSSLFSIRLVRVHVVYSYSRIDTTAAWKKSRFILSDRSDFHMIDKPSTADHDFASCIVIFSVNETLLPRYVNLFTSFREPLFIVETSPNLNVGYCQSFSLSNQKGSVGQSEVHLLLSLAHSKMLCNT